jgi:hypothetical protein
MSVRREPERSTPASPGTRAAGGPDHDDLRRYAQDPVGFAEQVLGVTPWQRQREALQALVDHPRVTIRSAHGVGKTWVASAALLWWLYGHQPSLVLSTAPTARQVESLLWAEVNRLWRRAGIPLPGRCLQTKLEAGLDQTALGLTTTEPERFAGWHNENILVIVDEASGVPDTLFEVVQGTLTTAHARLLLIGNPTRADGYFAESHRRAGWHKLKISAFDTPNFEGSGVRSQGSGRDNDEPALAGPDPRPLTPDPCLPCPWLVTPQWVEDRKAEWGEESDPFRVRVLGEFPRASDDALIELAWVEAAEQQGSGARGQGSGTDKDEAALAGPDPRPLTPDPCVFGVDVARYGSCETVIAVRAGDALVGVQHWRGTDLMHTCGRVVQRCRERRPQRVVIDAVGLGAGLVDRLLELQREGEAALREVQIVAFSSGARALNAERYGSRRDEAYWELRERYREGRIAHVSLAGASALTGQLTALRYRFTSRGQVEIESKDELRGRGLASPDQADAVALAFAPMAAPFVLPVALSSLRVVPTPMPTLRLPGC